MPSFERKKGKETKVNNRSEDPRYKNSLHKI